MADKAEFVDMISEATRRNQRGLAGYFRRRAAIAGLIV